MEKSCLSSRPNVGGGPKIYRLLKFVILDKKNIFSGMSKREIKELFDIWQMNMINCCQFEMTYLPIDDDQMLMILPDGKHILQVGNMLRDDKRCYHFDAVF